MSGKTRAEGLMEKILELQSGVSQPEEESVKLQSGASQPEDKSVPFQGPRSMPMNQHGTLWVQGINHLKDDQYCCCRGEILRRDNAHKLLIIDTRKHMHTFQNNQLRRKPRPKESLSGQRT